jgi:hypothetical protein
MRAYLYLIFYIFDSVKVYEIELISAYSISNTNHNTLVDSAKTTPLKPGKSIKSRRRHNAEDTHRHLDEELFRSLSEKHVTPVNRTEWQEQKWERFKTGRLVISKFQIMYCSHYTFYS